MDKLKLFTFLIAGFFAGVACVVGAFESAQAADASGPDKADPCPCLWYTSETCDCTDDESKCGCANCSRDANCECVEKLKRNTGAINGKLKSIYTRLAEGVVYISQMPDKTFRLPPQNPVMDQKNLIFDPHVLPVLIGSTVDFLNSDTVRHSVFSPPNAATVFNLGSYPTGVAKHMKFDQPGVVALLCNVHAEMSAYIVVCGTPYFARTNKKDGSFVIPNVPAGAWELTFYHPKLEPKTIPVTVVVGQPTSVEFTDLKRKRGRR